VNPEISLPAEEQRCYGHSCGRFTTHCLLGPPGSGELAVNGAPAALADAGDVVTISAYCHLDREDVPRHRARTLFVDERNRIVALREQTPFAPPDDEA
jgi:aspartate 1-decarboxylase